MKRWTECVVPFLFVVLVTGFIVSCGGGGGSSSGSPDKDGDGFTVAQGDCNDANDAIHPDAVETCNGIDDNCEGGTDEGNPGGGGICDTGEAGICAEGTEACQGGALICIQNVLSVSEICDGLDNDCDGAVDDGNPEGGALCDTGELGVCDAGTEVCQGGTLICNQDVFPVAEICDDGLDNDCNGFADEDCPVDCGPPTFPNADVADCTTHSFSNESCVVTCLEGYIGSPTATCELNGLWTTTGSCDPDGVDRTPPSIQSTSPSEGETGVSVNGPVQAVFDEDVDPTTCTTSTVRVRYGEFGGWFGGDVSCAGNVATFNPMMFTYDSLLTASISTGVTDLAGNPLETDYLWQFTTELPPQATLDSTFGTDGLVLTDLGIGDSIESMKILGNGMVLAGGNTGPGANVAILRYEANGDIDTTFGNQGALTIDLGGSDYFDEMVVLPDGKILCSMRTYSAGEGDVVLVRLNEVGTIDTAFGTEGFVVTDIGGNDHVNGLVVLPNGKIVVSGITTGTDLFLVRYLSDGAVDTSFGTNGIVIDSEGMQYTRKLLLQPDGKFIVSGSHQNVGAAYRYSSDGTVDGSFGGTGKVLLGGFADDAVLQTDGKIVLAGWKLNGGFYDATVARINSDGSVDVDFGTDGILTLEFAMSGSSSAKSLDVQGNGKIVVAGMWEDLGGTPRRMDMGVARLNSDGTLDATFGEGGTGVLDFGRTDDAAKAVKVQADGKILLGGHSADDFALARFAP